MDLKQQGGSFNYTKLSNLLSLALGKKGRSLKFAIRILSAWFSILSVEL